MANTLFDFGREAFLTKLLDWSADTIKAVLTDHGTATPNVSAHQFLSSFSAGTVATSPAFSSKTATAGVADAADITFTSVSGASCESVNIFKDTGSTATSNLIAYFDTATGLPITPSGVGITVAWSNGANRIFRL